MSNSSFLKQLGSAGSGAEIHAFQESPNVFGAAVSVLCDIHTTLCAVSKLSSSHNSDFSGGCANNSWSMSACRSGCVCVNCKLRCSHSLGDWFDHASQPTMFSETVSMVSVQTHLGLSAPLVTMEVLQNQNWTSRTAVLLSIDPSRLHHSVLPAADDRFTVFMTPTSLSEFSSFCRPFFTSLNRHSKDSFPSPASSLRSVFTVL